MNTRIIKNTLILYGRILFLALVTLYTVRALLNTLGVEEYGLFSVITGVVTLCAFLPGTLASATQRFFSFALGVGDVEGLKRTFVMTLLVYLAIGVLSLLLLELIGIWFVQEQLIVPEGRKGAAVALYHLTVCSFVVSMLSAPFSAIMIAHEDMHFYAYVSILDAFLKLLIVFSLEYFPWDALLVYGVLLLAVSLVTSACYFLVCYKNYQECRFYGFFFDFELARKMLSFTGWALFGQFSTVARNQAVTVLLNQFFGPVVVAARSIAMSVGTQVNVFSVGFNSSLYSPIVKSYAAGLKQEMYNFVYGGSKLTFFLMWIFALPLIVEMELVLQFWLKDPPMYSVSFTRLALIEALITAASLPLTTAARAPGKLALYELALGSIQIAVLIVSWLVLSYGYDPASVFVVAIIANLIMFFVRLWIVNFLTGISIMDYHLKVVFPILWVVMLSSLFSLFISFAFPEGYIYSLGSFILVLIGAFLSIYFVGIDREWRLKISNTLQAKLGRAQ